MALSNNPDHLSLLILMRNVSALASMIYTVPQDLSHPEVAEADNLDRLFLL
jgi:hypothetical protein